MSSETARRTKRNPDRYPQHGWDDEHTVYACPDGKYVRVPHRSANVRDLDEMKIVPRNSIRYTAGKKEVGTTVSGVEFDKRMITIFGGSDGIRTMIFPNMVRAVRQRSFCGMWSLKSVVLNEGLETLGTDEHSPGQPIFCGVF